jgi:hypothetical protein
LEARDSLPVFDKIIAYIDKKNGFNRCEACEEPYRYACTCGKSQDELSACECNGGEPLVCCPGDEPVRESFGAQEHPRNQPGFALLSSYEKATRLVQFHQLCIRNLHSFYDSALSTNHFWIGGGCGFSVEWYDDGRFGLDELQRFHPEAYNIACTVAELLLAKSDLERTVFWFCEAFAGVRNEPFTGSSFRDSMANMLISIVTKPEIEPLEEKLHVPDYTRRWSPSQVRRLDETLKSIIAERDEEADWLLGSKIADSIAVFQNAQVDWDSAFPLNWMPMFGGEDEDDSTADEHDEVAANKRPRHE